MHHPLRPWIAAALVSLAACVNDSARLTLPPDTGTPPAPKALGVYEIHITGIASEQIQSTVRPVRAPSNVRGTLTQYNTGLTFEQVSSTTVSDGPRGNDGQKYFSVTYRVRNATGGTRNNLIMLLTSTTSTIPGTAFSSVTRTDGTSVDTAIAKLIVPAGMVGGMGRDGVTLQSPFPDVLQVFAPGEVAAITPPADVTSVFPVGFVIRNHGNTSRQLPDATSSPNQFDGELTVSFRVPRQPTASQDVNGFFVQIINVEDSETWMTESIEEAQDTAAVRRLRERAASLGATVVTVLAGSPAVDASVTDYPGQRQICSVRTAGPAAGPAAAPVTRITSPAAYTQLALLLPGESVNSCGAWFRAGTPTAPSVGTPYTVSLKAMDRYGNVKTAAVDTVSLTQASGPAATFGSSAALVSGSAGISVTYGSSGVSVLNGIGRRLRGERTVTVP